MMRGRPTVSFRVLESTRESRSERETYRTTDRRKTTPSRVSKAASRMGEGRERKGDRLKANLGKKVRGVRNSADVASSPLRASHDLLRSSEKHSSFASSLTYFPTPSLLYFHLLILLESTSSLNPVRTNTRTLP